MNSTSIKYESKQLSQLYPYTRKEDILSCISHGLGVLLSIAALSILVTFAAIHGDAWRVVSFSIYGSTLILLYLASTLYHIFNSPRIKSFFHVMDHVSIFLLIAGTYTPVTLINLRGAWGWSIFGVIWGLAAVGIVLKIFFTGRFDITSTIIYILMGWIIIIAMKPAIETIPPGGLVWLVAGGLSYTFGVIFYLWDSLPYNHAIWHLFVIVGSICHFFMMLLHILPEVATT